MCVVVTKENKCNFSWSGTEIIRTYPISKHLWKRIKLYMQGQLLLRPYRKLMEKGRLLAVVIEQ